MAKFCFVDTPLPELRSSTYADLTIEWMYLSCLEKQSVSYAFFVVRIVASVFHSERSASFGGEDLQYRTISCRRLLKFFTK